MTPCTGAGGLASPLAPSPGEVKKSGARMLFPAEGEDIGLPPADVAVVHKTADDNSVTPVNRLRDAPNTSGVRSGVTNMPAPPANKGSGATASSPVDRDSEVGTVSYVIKMTTVLQIYS